MGRHLTFTLGALALLAPLAPAQVAVRGEVIHTLAGPAA